MVENYEIATQNSVMERDYGAELMNPAEAKATNYVSFNPETPEEKAKLFNAITNPKGKIADMVGKTLLITDVFVETVWLPSKSKFDANGNPIKEPQPRVVLIDKDGNGWQSISIGIYNSFQKVCAVFGAPHWEKPLAFEIVQINKENSRILTFNVKA